MTELLREAQRANRAEAVTIVRQFAEADKPPKKAEEVAQLLGALSLLGLTEVDFEKARHAVADVKANDAAAERRKPELAEWEAKLKELGSPEKIRQEFYDKVALTDRAQREVIAIHEQAAASNRIKRANPLIFADVDAALADLDKRRAAATATATAASVPAGMRPPPAGNCEYE
jgi:hypothetical protein